jgi:hypothetical protein
MDNELKAALRRKEPPPGFTERVLAAIDRDDPTAARPPRRGHWRAVAAAALLVIGLGGGEAVRIARAKQQMLTALHITGAKLHDARNHVNDISR